MKSFRLQLALHAPYKAFIFNLRLLLLFLILLSRHALPKLGLGVFPLAYTGLFTCHFPSLN